MVSIGESSGDNECHELRLARRVASQDSAAWDELTRNVLPWLAPYCCNLCRHYGVPISDAEDVSTEVLYALIRRLTDSPTFLRRSDCGSFCAYLRRAAHNNVYSRKNRLKYLENQHLYAKSEEVIDLRLSELENSEWVEHVLSFLHPRDRQMLRFRLNGRSAGDIAEKFDITPNAVHRQMLRLMKDFGRFGMEDN